MPVLDEVGFRCFRPRGAYYVMTDISAFGFENDLEFTKYLVKEIGVAAVPGSSFYNDPRDGAQQVRFAFCKRDETLDAAGERLQKLRIPTEIASFAAGRLPAERPPSQVVPATLPTAKLFEASSICFIHRFLRYTALKFQFS